MILVALIALSPFELIQQLAATAFSFQCYFLLLRESSDTKVHEKNLMQRGGICSAHRQEADSEQHDPMIGPEEKHQLWNLGVENVPSSCQV